LTLRNDGLVKNLTQAGGHRASAPEPDAQGHSLWYSARPRFMRNKAAVFSLGLLTLITLACVVGPMAAAPRVRHRRLGCHEQTTDAAELAFVWHRRLRARPVGAHLIGGRVSLMVGLMATLSSVSLGIAWGAVAGFMGGKVDAVMMRVVDMMYAVPYLLIAILLVTILGRAFYLVVITITVFSWMDMARVVRGQTLSLRSQRVCRSGTRHWRAHQAHHLRAHRAQPAGHCGDLHHGHRAGRDIDRVGAVVFGAGHSGTDDQLGRAD
jgi:oligopeptide transport system permease protein